VPARPRVVDQKPLLGPVPRGDAGRAVATRRELEGEGAASDVERVDDQVEDAIARGPLAGRPDAVAEVLVESSRPAIPVSRDLLLDLVAHATCIRYDSP
jgi:hypothetical protein